MITTLSEWSSISNQSFSFKALRLYLSTAVPSHRFLRSLSWKESKHLLLLTNLRFDHWNLFTRFERLSLTSVGGVDDFGLLDLANLVGS